MKTINILSLIQAFKSLQKEEYNKLLSYHGIEIKDDEVKTLQVLINILKKSGNVATLLNSFNQFYVGYKILQISKEFDLLQFRENSIVNIELKRESTEEKVLKQLSKNKYYLSFLGKHVFNFAFIEKTKKLYKLDNSKIVEVAFIELLSFLKSENVIAIENIDKLFDPTNYLVSPFNTTDKFIDNQYFLTNQQETIKKEILQVLKKNDSEANFLAITGDAGTGKTLLTYDIAKTFINKKKNTLIIHCGNLNEGQLYLINKYSWEIIPIKSYTNRELNKYELIIVDEAQRIRSEQLEEIVKKISTNKGNCIFSYDKQQTLAIWEDRQNLEEKIKLFLTKKKYKLSEKIRTNKDIASFIKRLFNEKRNDLAISNKENINIAYFDSYKLGREYATILSLQEWQVLRFTPSQYNQEKHEEYAIHYAKTSHQIIGQEFDNVAVILDECFFYNDDGKLQYGCRAYYHPVKMLFQNLTRTRKKLHIIIIKNPTLLNRCLSILK